MRFSHSVCKINDLSINKTMCTCIIMGKQEAILIFNTLLTFGAYDSSKFIVNYTYKMNYVAMNLDK